MRVWLRKNRTEGGRKGDARGTHMTQMVTKRALRQEPPHIHKSLLMDGLREK